MKDIDFDELDRAVSSVLGQRSSGDNTAATAQASVSGDSAQVVDTSQAVNVNNAQTTASRSQSTTPLAIKRRGKFMDMVHPSADMTSSAPPVTPARTKPLIEPLSSSVIPEEPQTEVVDEPDEPEVIEPTAKLDESNALIGAEPVPVENLLPEHTTESEVVDVKTPTVEDVAKVDESDPAPTTLVSENESVPAEPPKEQDSLYVDPLDLSHPEETVQEEAIAEHTAEVPPHVEPVTTPFLADAQVEKRPLGAFGDAESTETSDAVETAEPESPVENSNTTDTQSAPAVPLPRELQPDVVEVESSSQEPETSPVPQTSNPKATESQDGRVEGHPLFDTSTYHEPIAAVHGKGLPGWAKWLIGLLTCLALGAGVGYFLFTAGL